MKRPERILNYRLSRARRVVENAFGILANMFQVLLSTMQQQPETVKLIITACMLLNNLMRTRYPGMQNQHIDRAENLGRDYIPGAWRTGLRNATDRNYWRQLIASDPAMDGTQRRRCSCMPILTLLAGSGLW